MRFLAGLVMTLACTMPALANDTSAVLTTGGLEFVTNSDIVMQSEDLFISKEQIKVDYVFRNDGTSDQTILVAFPMPDIVPNFYSPIAFPTGPDDNLFEFETTFDGKPVTATLHEYAFAHGVDRTDVLKQMGLPMVPISEGAQAAIEALDPESQAQLLHLGMITPDEYDDGQGMKKHYWPGWTYKATYTWEGTFPAGKTVNVVHSYKPSVGGTAGIAFLSEPYEGYDPAVEYATKYCTDQDFLDTVRSKLKNPEESWSAPYMESWISYILTTGGNWGGNGIEKFRLVIDKGNPKNLLSFCGKNVTKTGPTTFEMTEENFWPERELDILILDYHAEMEQ
ncbi:DUF4424 domain-containing protein [Devosia sp. FKR38]|uniref:DUF4424 domain-containing protein n=1 Tax=Devosia sp. FKR38 TaxID=2562312 RepID=UPI001485959D|nr:DUF4424 domain-containing protein [Devosia sp. FKR38]